MRPMKKKKRAGQFCRTTCHVACKPLYITHARLSLCACSARSYLVCCFVGSAIRRFTMGRGKKRKRELHMFRPAAPWEAESEENWWSLTDGYEEQWLSYDSHELDQKRIQELEDLLHAERSQRKKAQDLVARYEKAQQRLLNIVVKEFTLPRPPEPPPLFLTRHPKSGPRPAQPPNRTPPSSVCTPIL